LFEQVQEGVFVASQRAICWTATTPSSRCSDTAAATN